MLNGERPTPSKRTSAPCTVRNCVSMLNFHGPMYLEISALRNMQKAVYMTSLSIEFSLFTSLDDGLPDEGDNYRGGLKEYTVEKTVAFEVPIAT